MYHIHVAFRFRLQDLFKMEFLHLNGSPKGFATEACVYQHCHYKISSVKNESIEITTGARLYLYEPRPPMFYTKFDKIYYICLCNSFLNSSLPLSDEQT